MSAKPHPPEAQPALRGAPALQARAETLGHTLPPLMAEAEMLAAHVMLGEHGRRRAGPGDEFWQYRPAHTGDGTRSIDWRQSAKSDGQYVREREWQAAQSVTLWVDPGQSMDFSGDVSRGTKAERAQLLALATAVLLLRSGERVGLAGDVMPPRPGRAQIVRLAAVLSGAAGAEEYGKPSADGMVAHGRALFISDFFGDLTEIEAALMAAADRGVRGALVQVLDPAEEEFPFSGRTIFESMGGGLRHETQQAGELRSRYLARLAARKDRLAELARLTGWHVTSHHTGQPAQAGLQWIYHALQGWR